MKLFYYQFPKHQYPTGLGNFGDDLNPWLWQKLIPEYLDHDRHRIFVGIGTLLNDGLTKQFSRAKHIVIFSSGVGYGGGLPTVTNAWSVYCVRGPLSAQALGLADDRAVTDGGILVRQVFRPAGQKRFSYSFMPHAEHAACAGRIWPIICEQIGFHYIDPRQSVDRVLHDISETEVLLTEAMHGAIAADALDVPWIPICTSHRILPFKWQDWCASLGLTYEPQHVLPLWDLYQFAPGVRSSLRYCATWLQQDRFHSLRHLFTSQPRSVAAQLRRIAKSVRPTLSDRTRLKSRIEELEYRLHQFRVDVMAGKFD